VLEFILLVGGVTLGAMAASGGFGRRAGWLEPLRGVRLWQVMAAVAGIAVLLAMLEYPLLPFLALLLLAAAPVVLVLFAKAWGRDFVFVMVRRDDEFPGRFDKVIWAALLIALPPVGLWLFRHYREARWPEPETGGLKVDPAFAPDGV